MAGISQLSGAVPPLKTVEEMSISCDEPPPEFIVKEGTVNITPSNEEENSIPIIDVSLLSSNDELQKLRSALSSGGCFQAVGHGISSSLLEKAMEIAKQFYDLPMEEKQKYARAADNFEGYGEDRIVSEKQVLDWCSRLSLLVFPELKRKLNFWPENPNSFGEILHEYVSKIKELMDQLFMAMEKSLNIEENSFKNQFGEATILKARFNFYPRCSRPDQVLGIKPHSDRSAMTVLLQSKDVQGLQVIKDGKWITVPVIPNALVVNLGDQMQIMSNGIFKSPLHRVLANQEKLRISVAVFNEPEPDKEIGPLESLISESRPRLYRTIKNYGLINYECFQKGTVALDEVKI